MNKNDKEGEEGGGYTSPTAPPSLDEIKAECRLQKYDAVNPDVFYSYYQARHWRLGGEPIDWRAMLRHWDLKDAGNGDKPTKKKPISADEINDIAKSVFERRSVK